MGCPLYSVGTWDTDLQAYTPQDGLTVPSQNVPIGTLRRVLDSFAAWATRPTADAIRMADTTTTTRGYWWNERTGARLMGKGRRSLCGFMFLQRLAPLHRGRGLDLGVRAAVPSAGTVCCVERELKEEDL